jgi:hypothetical protein
MAHMKTAQKRAITLCDSECVSNRGINMTVSLWTLDNQNDFSEAVIDLPVP